MKTRNSLFLALIILITACTPTEIASPTQAATATMLTSPSATNAPTQTATQPPIPPTATTTPAPFSALHAVSLQYLAPTEADAIEVAQSLGYLASGAHPSNMCGPLAAIILREGGVISPYTDLYNFWLLNPRAHQATLKRVFPESRFTLTEIRMPLLEYDFAANPLEVGDFLYLYAGPNGNFEHMLTVTRIDEAGRAYTVTNVNTDDGYYVDEFVLYDPSAPQEGLFYRWNNREYDYLGLTGSGGFDIWRPLTDWETGDAALTESINNTIESAGGEWHILIKELDGEILYQRNTHDNTHIASIIKIPIALLFMQSIQPQPTDLNEYLASHAREDRSYEQLLSAMLVNSEEPATGAIYRITQKNGLDFTSTLENWGVEDVNIPYRKTTLHDLSLLLEGLYLHELVSNEASNLLLTLMSEYTENDDQRTGVLKEDFPEAKIYNKRGTLTDQFLVIGDVAIIEVNEKVYLVMIVGSQDKSLSVNNADLANTIEDIVRDFGAYLKGE